MSIMIEIIDVTNLLLGVKLPGNGKKLVQVTMN